jgi:thioredoxin 1
MPQIRSPFTDPLARRLGEGVALMECGAPWCAPCRLQRPIVESVVRRHRGRVRVIPVNVEAEPDLARRLKIRSIPTLVLFADGREQQRLEGLHPAEAITEALEGALAVRSDKAPSNR